MNIQQKTKIRLEKNGNDRTIEIIFFFVWMDVSKWAIFLIGCVAVFFSPLKLGCTTGVRDNDAYNIIIKAVLMDLADVFDLLFSGYFRWQS